MERYKETEKEQGLFLIVNLPEQVVKAMAEDTEPHYTTISNFVSGMSSEIGKVFSEVLMVCASAGFCQ